MQDLRPIYKKLTVLLYTSNEQLEIELKTLSYVSLSKRREIVKDREAWHAHGVTKSQT